MDCFVAVYHAAGLFRMCNRIRQLRSYLLSWGALSLGEANSGQCYTMAIRPLTTLPDAGNASLHLSETTCAGFVATHQVTMVGCVGKHPGY